MRGINNGILLSIQIICKQEELLADTKSGHGILLCYGIQFYKIYL